MAPHVDALYFYLIAVSGLLLGSDRPVLVIFFAIRYRRRSAGRDPQEVHESVKLEIVWTSSRSPSR